MVSLIRASFDFSALDPLSCEASFRLSESRKGSRAVKISGSHLTLGRRSNARLRIVGSVEEKHTSIRKASKESLRFIREHKGSEKLIGSDPFEELEFRFKSFKQKNYTENLIHYQKLSELQSPKFMVIACADSRVCPSNILGFQPGEAFTVRNVANLVPPFQHGVSETSAALEFAVNSLKVANILVVGHSRCGGIQALMKMKEDVNSRSFINEWVSIGKSARLSTKAAAGNMSFEVQCRHCEKESINGSLLNLLSYPWIEQRVSEGILSLHGGYYDFSNCTFEKWTLVYREGLEGGSKYAIKNPSFWS
ncbi:beta carbonic anhydrase 5, chloroplastic-like [Zingiber officinale]|uniref:beta carbonic anhydrase 5, chloroplastic-like n=1 Tax=Zingiber officinale TaxID=94328 RepID=UPI001C4A8BB7|nr:beta carbonic anhydrase 5, chloroplastic-like [Zingiber officinale]